MFDHFSLLYITRLNICIAVAFTIYWTSFTKRFTKDFIQISIRFQERKYLIKRQTLLIRRSNWNWYMMWINFRVDKILKFLVSEDRWFHQQILVFRSNDLLKKTCKTQGSAVLLLEKNKYTQSLSAITQVEPTFHILLHITYIDASPWQSFKHLVCSAFHCTNIEVSTISIEVKS